VIEIAETLMQRFQQLMQGRVAAGSGSEGLSQ
jgi:hypothetical protein